MSQYVVVCLDPSNEYTRVFGPFEGFKTRLHMIDNVKNYLIDELMDSDSYNDRAHAAKYINDYKQFEIVELEEL